jgi:hypothetical protein
LVISGFDIIQEQLLDSGIIRSWGKLAKNDVAFNAVNQNAAEISIYTVKEGGRLLGCK